MAKQGSGKTLAEKSEMQATPVIGGLDLYYPVLIDCNLDWSPEGPPGDTAERFYDSAIRISEKAWKEEVTVAVCSFSAGKKVKENKIVEIRAAYAIAVSCTGDRNSLSRADRKKLLEEAAGVSAWPLFRSLFAQIASQTNLELPLLPNAPKLRWLRPGEEKHEDAD